ncbi:hypothetical protein [Achromobacter sp. DH1f]|uniref:hypothetical protein n=1 Tax=Achromobacter sp. DH1f TaxID=1397275 RepID=UPI00046A9A4B|nr:hypothetical protein [Achromobacter sp. DH1f]
MKTPTFKHQRTASIALAKYGWIGESIAIGAPCPADLGLMWHVLDDDQVDVESEIMAITAAGGVIVKMSARNDDRLDQIDLIFAITPAGYEKLSGHAAQPMEWLKVEADDDVAR